MMDRSLTGEKKNENEAMAAPTTKATAIAPPKSLVACDCPNGCQPFQFLPMQQGIMITLRRHQQQYQHCATAAAFPKRASAVIQSHHPTTSNNTITPSSSCRLEIHPQKDANLLQFHPNIYIPEVLLEYPDHLIKYGGGGKRECFLNF